MVDVAANLPPEPDPKAEPPSIELSEERPPNAQLALAAIGDEFSQHDRIALSRLSAKDVTAQAEARAHLWQLVLTYWEQAKADGIDVSGPEWESVAGMLDLAVELSNNADAAQDAAEAE